MFTYKGISTKEMRIIVEEPDNLIAKAPIKHEILNIEGRDDAIYYPLGRSPIEISLTLQLLDPSKVDQVLMWLDGEGELIYKDRKTKARMFSEVQPIRTSGIRLINIDVVRAPYWDVITDDYSKPWGANLIPNGWDDFGPYGSGKNYVDNWDFNNNIVSFADYRVTSKINNNQLHVVSVGGESAGIFKKDIPYPGDVVVRMKVKAPTGMIYGFTSGGSGEFVKVYPSEDYQIVEGNFKITDLSNQITIYANLDRGNSIKGDNFIIDWIQITPVDNQHLVVEKTALGNGLTRVQTWGGNNRVKLIYTNPIDSVYTTTFFLKIDRYFEYLTSDNTSKAVRKYEELFFIGSDYRLSAIGRILALKTIDNLDFIASTPTIVKGDKSPTWEADEFPRIVNEGNAVAKPLIRLTKGTSSTCEFEVNGIYFKYHFNQDDEVVIDCEKMEASDEGQLRNRHLTIGYEFPKLDPGPNVVKTISGDAIIEFKRKDRWL